jgi:hypothetical protein
MAKKVIKGTDLIEKDALKNAIKDFETLIATVNLATDALKGVLAESIKISKVKTFDNYDDLQKAQKGVEGIENAVEGLTKAEKERAKLQQKLSDLRQEEAKQNAVIQVQITEQRKALREEAKARAGLIGEYAKQSKRLTDLRKAYKDLALTEGEASQEAQDLLNEITQLDKALKELDNRVGQNTREVGSYKKQLMQLERQLGNVEDAVDKTNNALKALGILTFLNALQTSFAGSEKGGVAFQKVLTSITVTLALFVERLVKLFESTDSIFDLYENGKKVFKDFSSEAEALIEKQLKLVDAEEKLRKSTLAQQVAIADLRKQYEALRTASEDTTIPLQKQAEASEKAVGLLISLNAKELELAKERLANAKTALDNNATNVSAQQAYAEAYVAFIDIQINAQNELLDVQKTGTEAYRDILEQELDFLFDVSDARKTTNERLLENDRATTTDRLKAITDSEKDIADSFDNVIDRVIAYQEAVNKSNARIGKSTTDTANLEIKLREAMSATTTEEVAKQIKALELDEIVKRRILELARELEAAERDFADSKVKSTEIIEQELDLNRQIELQNARLLALQNTSIDLDEEQRKANEALLDSEIQLLQAQLETLEDGSVKKLEVQKKLNDLIIQRTIEQVKKVKSIEEKALEDAEKLKQKEIEAEKLKQERIAELQQLGVQGAQALAQKAFENTNANIDREIQAVQNRQEVLRGLASRGQQDAEKNLAIEEKRQAELEARRAQAIRRQKQVELGLAVLETYSNKVANDEKNPLSLYCQRY